ncbi:MAG: hypothetical protein CMD01_01355 [Flavobacteriales bacterium]|nr:hypothetical protein [Flavobacteriales bacterium]
MKNTITLFILCFGISSFAQTYFSEDFEPSGGTLTQNNAWTTQVVTAHPDGYDWYHSDFSGDAFAKVSNYNNSTSSNSPMETWLISPVIDLSLATAPNLNFENVKRFSGADLNVLISTDYASSASPSWTDITSFLNMDSDISSWNFVNSGDLDISPYIASSASSVTIAFQYQGGSSDGSTYEIDDIIISEGASGPTIVSIYDIQFTTSSPANSPYTGQQVNTGGIVTYVRTDGTYYLQSGFGPWSGVYVYDSISTVVAGDSVTLSCEVDEFFELTELKNITNLTVVSQGNTFTTNIISSSQANSEKFEGCLVSVVSATCTNANAGFGEWTINDGSGPCNVDDFIFPFSPTLNAIYDVSGLIDYSFGNYKILPRDIDDIDEITSTYFQNIDTDFSIYPNPCNSSVLQLNISYHSNVKIFSSIGEVCFIQQVSPGKNSIDISNFSKGIYLVSINNVCKKLIIN